jgi:predicted transcriptional regulator of viral defense system
VTAHTYDMTTTLALRDAALRRHHAVLVLLVVWPTLDAEDPRPVKIQHVAEYLHIERQTVRRAMSLLVRRGYVEKRVASQPPNVPAQYCRRTRSGDGVPTGAASTGSDARQAA